MLLAGWEVRIGKNCGRGLENNAKGNRPQAARELTEDEEDLLFETGQFGEDDPEVLQRTVWWVLSLHFGLRARDECRTLEWGDIAVEDDPVSGKQVLVWKAERGSKTRQGDGHCRAFSPKPTPPTPSAAQFVFILSLPAIVLTK